MPYIDRFDPESYEDYTQRKSIHVSTWRDFVDNDDAELTSEELNEPTPLNPTPSHEI